MATNEVPLALGGLRVSIYGTADSTVPNWSSSLDGAENIAIVGVEHDGPTGVLEDAATFEELRRVLRYPAWER